MNIPAEILVNGKWKPTRNSNGKLIHPTPEGLLAFWKWFGDSKVVDDAGRPLVVYHGGAPNIDAFDNQKYSYQGSLDSVGTWFTSEKSQAPRYRQEAEVYSVYLSIKEPMIFASEEGRLVAFLNRAIKRRRGQLDSMSKKIKELRESRGNTDAIEELKVNFDTIKNELNGFEERLSSGEPFNMLFNQWTEFHGDKFGDPNKFIGKMQADGYDGIILKDTAADFGLQGADYADWFIAPYPSQIKSAIGTVARLMRVIR